MTDPLVEVYRALMGSDSLSDLMDTDQIYSIRVPDDFQKAENAPIIRINELDYYRSGWADDQVRFFDTEIQVDVWGGQLADVSEIAYVIDDVMADIDYRQYKSATDLDTDINLYRKARRYRAQKQFERMT